MNVTLADYDQALEGFVADMGRMGDDVASVLLYGSIARGDITPGKSDLMDAHVFLKQEVFDDRERFLAALDAMVEACRHLAQRGIPFHPFHYFSLEEIDCSPALYLPTWESEHASRVLLGADLRSQIGSKASSRKVAATSFFEARRNMAHTLAIYLNKHDWTLQDRENIIHSLASLKKHITIMACITLGVWVEASQALPELRKALPGLDTSVLRKVDQLQQLSPPARLVEDIREILRETLIFVETLHDRIIAELNHRRVRNTRENFLQSHAAHSDL